VTPERWIAAKLPVMTSMPSTSDAQITEYVAAERAWSAIVGKMSVPPTDEQVAIARRFVQASRYRFRRRRVLIPEPNGDTSPISTEDGLTQGG
jgi:hypothetical protein